MAIGADHSWVVPWHRARHWRGAPHPELDGFVVTRKRHVTAKTNVEVYRLFGIRDMAIILRRSEDQMTVAIGEKIFDLAHQMVEPYVTQQDRLAHPEDYAMKKQLQRAARQLVHGRDIKTKKSRRS